MVYRATRGRARNNLGAREPHGFFVLRRFERGNGDRREKGAPWVALRLVRTE
jgi:hypothetical protein